MLEISKIYFFWATIVMVAAARNIPMDEETAKAQLITVIDDHCKLINIDKKSINQLINYFHMKENIDNITACDLACDAFKTSKDELADVILKSDGDLFYAIDRVNKLFDTELLELKNDIITINIDGFNCISQRTAKYTVEKFGEKNKVAAYMLKNLLDVQNRTNYPLMKEHISRIQIPAEEVLLTLLPTIDSYHKFMRDNEMQDEIDYEEQEYNYEDSYFEEEQTKNNDSEVKTSENSPEPVTETTVTEIITTLTTKKQYVETIMTEAPEKDKPRLIDQFINSDLPLEKLKAEYAQEKHQESEGNKGRGREISNDNIKGLYDTDDLDYAGIRNVGRARLEQDAARNAYANDDDYDYKKYQVNTRDMADYSDSVESKETGDGRTNNNNTKPNSTKPEAEPKPSQTSKPTNNNDDTNKTKPPPPKDPRPTEDSDEAVQGRDAPVSNESDEPPASRDFYVSYESSEEKFDSVDQKSQSGSSGGIFSLMTNPIKKGLAGALKFGRKAVDGLFNGANKLAVSVLTKPDNWFERMANYPKNFVVLRMIDSIHLAQKWVKNVLNPMIDNLEGKGGNGKDNDSRGMNPFSAFTNPIKTSIRAFVRSIGDGIINSVGKIPILGRMISQGVNTTVQFFDGFLNRILP